MKSGSLSLAIVMVFVAACASYYSPPLEQGVSLNIDNQSGGDVLVLEVDGLEVENERRGLLILSSGIHTLSVQIEKTYQRTLDVAY